MDDLDSFYTTGRTKPRLLQALTFLSICRYATLKQLQTVKTAYRQHIFTTKAVKMLVDLGYLGITGNGTYFTDSKGLNFLEENKISTYYFLSRNRAVAGEHTLKITDYIISLQSNPSFFTAFYPQFTKPPDYTEVFLIPDICVIYRKEDSYKIEFIEIEISDKGDPEYILKKKAKYQQIAKDKNTYLHWWKFHCGKLGLPMCSVEQFCFNMEVIK